MHLRPSAKPVSYITITNKAHEYGLLDKTGIEMTQSSENKWMFEAKRLDNGEVINGSLVNDKYIVGFFNVDSPNPNSELMFCDVDCHEIDPPTIKPLFTTTPEKPDEWLFENSEHKTFIDCTPEEKEIICQARHSDMSRVEYICGTSFRACESLVTDVGMLRVYRVKAPKYTIDDALSDADNLQVSDVYCFEFRRIIEKFAKANGLGGS